MTLQDIREAATSMQMRGGHFVHHLGVALLYADDDYARRLAEAVPGIIEQYLDLARKEATK